jgi:hypothetical protein
MKSFVSPSFFRVFDLLLSTTNPGMKRARWTHDGIEFEQDRHSFSGPKHGLTIEIYTLTRSGRRGWSFMVTKEYWWTGPDKKALKNLRWARPIGGARIDILTWMRTQESLLNRALPRMGSAYRDNEKTESTIDDAKETLTFDDDEGR